MSNRGRGITIEQAVWVAKKAAELIREGCSKRSMPEKLGFSLETINKYHSLYIEGGEAAIEKRIKAGRKAKATALPNGERKSTPALDVDCMECDLWNFAIFGNKCKFSAGMSL